MKLSSSPAIAQNLDAQASDASHPAPIELGATPRLSIVIPIYNEEAILKAAVVDLLDQWREHDDYEVLLAENGSSDATVSIAKELSERFKQVRYFSTGEPNYGKALREGIARARGTFVLCDEIDLCDVQFHQESLKILEAKDAEFVVGSKLLSDASDERPWVRHFASHVLNGLLRVLLGFRGTDTHGLKAFRRERLQDIAETCVVDKDVFASEFVIRAERAGIQMKEIPVRVLEKRAPSIHLFRRVPNVLKNLFKLFVAIRLKS